MERALKALWLVAFTDFFLGRLLTRAGIFMPKAPGMLAAYRLLSDLGQIAFNLSLLGGTLALGWALWLHARTGDGGGRLARLAAALGAGAALAVLAGPATPVPAVSLATTLLLGLAVLALGAVAVRRAGDRFARLGLAAALGANLAWYGVTFVQLLIAALGSSADLAGVTPALAVGELLALLAPVLLAVPVLFSVPDALVPAPGVLAPGVPAPRGAESRALGLVSAPASGWMGGPAPAGPSGPVRRPARKKGRTTGLALAGAVALGVGYAAGTDLAGVLAIWSLGFTLVWPAPLYAAAVGAGLYLLLRLLAGPPAARLRAVGLGLLFCAGLVLQTNQQHVLVLLAWALLGLGRLPAVPDTRPALPGGEPA